MKPTLTLGIVTKSQIYALTVSSITSLSSCKELTDSYNINTSFLINQSDLPKARSIMLTGWYEKSTEKDIFMSIDADQIFSAEDIVRSIIFLSKYDIVCAAYPRKDGKLAVEPMNIVDFYRNRVGELFFGATGMMMVKYSTVKNLISYLKNKIPCSTHEYAYPFYYQRIVEDSEMREEKNLWLGEDYSFCWLARKYANAIIFGFVSSTVGHIVTDEKLASVPTKNTWSNNSIVIYCGNTSEPWSAKSLETGIGGSESAIIRLSKYWKSQGYEVTVYCSCDAPGIYDDVIYRQHTGFNMVDDFNILIIWRSLEFPHVYHCKAKKVFVDLHDLIEKYISDRSLNYVTKYCVKSNFQRQMLKNIDGKSIDDNKVAIIPNGGAIEYNHTEKIPGYIIYSSSYDRGLYDMLKYGWPIIKQKCPHAFLKIFYGWNAYDKITKGSKEAILYKEELLKLMSQDGIEECGRISNERLLQEKSKAVIHYYMATFEEIDCISIRESACLQAIPIVSEYGVFPEKKHCVIVPGNPKEQNTQEKAAEVIVKILTDNNYENEIRKNLSIPYYETWENTAEKWINLFEN